MSHIVVVPGCEIKWSKPLKQDNLKDLKEFVKDAEDSIHLDSDGLYIYEYEWYNYRPIEDALIKIAKYISKNRISALGGLFAYFGDKMNGLVMEVDSHKLSLKRGRIKYSSGQIKAFRKVHRKKK